LQLADAVSEVRHSERGAFGKIVISGIDFVTPE
jgi:hypothetical protein